jgi:rubredoxin
MEKYKCTICGYIYDPDTGDPEHQVAAGTSFQNIPSGWECPVCGVSVDDFVLIVSES